MPSDQEKREFRPLAKAARAHAAAAAGPGAAAALAGNVLGILSAAADTVVSGYLPIGDEIDVTPLLERLHADGVACALPVVAGTDRPLVFRRWRPGIELEDGPLNTRHPGPESEELTPDILLVPMLAFDGGGYRIGWGGGYYDRTIAALRAAGPVVAIGVAYEGQRAEAVPHDDRDQPLDWIATEAGVIEIGVKA